MVVPPVHAMTVHIDKDTIEELVRKRRLLETLGFSEEEALRLALSGVSVSEAREMILNGCSHELATKILI